MDEVDLVPSKVLTDFWRVAPAARAKPKTLRATAPVGAKRRRRSRVLAARRVGQADSSTVGTISLRRQKEAVRLYNTAVKLEVVPDDPTTLDLDWELS